MPVRVFTQRNAAAVLLLTSAGVFALNMGNKPRKTTTISSASAQGSAAAAGTGAIPTPSFALGGCERSGGGV